MTSNPINPASINPLTVDSIIAIKDTVLVKNIERGLERTSSGLILPDDDMKDRGIKPRWGEVYAVGPEQKDVEVGDFILIDHGRWTHGVAVKDSTGECFFLHRVENSSILMKSKCDYRNRTIPI